MGGRFAQQSPGLYHRLQMPPMRITRAGLIGSLLVLIVAATCVRLGFWQLHRLGERRARNALAATRLAAPAATLERADDDTAGLTFRQAVARGSFDSEHSIVWAGRSFQGDPGVYLLTPLLLPGGGALLVNRGWLPSPDAATVELAPYRVTGALEVRGILVPFPLPRGAPETVTQRVRYRLDRQVAARLLPYSLEPLLLQLTPSTGDRTLPRPLPPPELDDGPHLSYAVQWFSFAVIGIVGWIALLLRGGRAGAEADAPSPPE